MALSKKRIAAGVAVAGLAAVGAVALGTSAFADPTASPSASPSSSASAGATAPGGKADHQRGNGQAPQHTAVTGDAAQKVKDAIAAKFSGVTITEVTADGDGSYDAEGTLADGTSVRYEVSLDLATITEGTAGRGGPGGKGGASQDTAVTGDEATKVKDAVVAKNVGVTITEVRKDPDGSYDALGTLADDTLVMYDVSTDLATITQGGKR